MTEVGRYRNKVHTEILNEIYQKAQASVNSGTCQELFNQLDDSERSNLQIIINHCESAKGVLTVLMTSLVHKLHNPNQDIRLHQDNMKGGYSGRVVDAKYITPFMKAQGFPAMAESGWLTRSLEQNLPYDLHYPGKIRPPELKKAFLELLDLVQTQNRSPEKYLLVLFAKLIEYREKKAVDLAKPTGLSIPTIIGCLKQHFEANYSSRGASRLPVLAVYAVYQCMIKELKRFEGKTLLLLEEHTSSDRSSGRVGDIEVHDDEGRVFEAVEIKHGIPINSQLVKCAYEKFKKHPIKRYYLLSTADVDLNDIENINKEVYGVSKIHGCQIIVNGIYPSLKYYLRVLHNADNFIDNYVENLKKDKVITYEHKVKWNQLLSSLG